MAVKFSCTFGALADVLKAIDRWVPNHLQRAQLREEWTFVLVSVAEDGVWLSSRDDTVHKDPLILKVRDATPIALGSFLIPRTLLRAIGKERRPSEVVSLAMVDQTLAWDGGGFVHWDEVPAQDGWLSSPLEFTSAVELPSDTLRGMLGVAGVAATNSDPAARYPVGITAIRNNVYAGCESGLSREWMSRAFSEATVTGRPSFAAAMTHDDSVLVSAVAAYARSVRLAVTSSPTPSEQLLHGVLVDDEVVGYFAITAGCAAASVEAFARVDADLDRLASRASHIVIASKHALCDFLDRLSAAKRFLPSAYSRSPVLKTAELKIQGRRLVGRQNLRPTRDLRSGTRQLTLDLHEVISDGRSYTINQSPSALLRSLQQIPVTDDRVGIAFSRLRGSSGHDAEYLVCFDAGSSDDRLFPGASSPCVAVVPNWVDTTLTRRLKEHGKPVPPPL